MHTDIVDLREFYMSPLGDVVRRFLRARFRQIWPDVRGERILALGYGLPLLRPLLDEALSLAAFMPAAQGVAFWPREGPNISSLVDTTHLPLADNSIDRVILLHALESAPDPHSMLREMWRVLKSGGRLLVLVPNRRGFWTHSDITPFGTGEPYSSSQIKTTLRDHGFLVERVWRTLYMPPTQSRLMLSLADFFEKYGEKLCPAFGGLLLVEAGKQLYAPLVAKSRTSSRRLIVPMPLPIAPKPVGV
jgi:SAM-dependent methyltransferase